MSRKVRLKREDNMGENKRATLGGRLSAVLVAAGSAVGLGNIWRFPYIAGENGGGAFLVIYIGCILLLGVPVLLAEFTVGRHTHKNSVGAYRLLSKKWSFLGYNSVISSLLILGFYFVVSGWTLEYFTSSITGAISEYSSSTVNAERFADFTTDPVRPVIFTVIFALLTHVVIALGVQKGIERSSKLMMPILFVMLVVLAIRSITMPNGLEGLKFLFTPDFSKVTAKTFLDAMGQAFFSLSIGLGCMITYSSYFNDKTNLQNTAYNVVILDTLVAVLSGAMIFPAVFSVGIEPTSGPSLVFVTLPSIFNTMTFGSLWSAIFFLLLILAALTSTISLHEVLTVYLNEEWGISRKHAARCVTLVTTLLASASSLSLGVWGDFKICGLNLFDSLDFVTANILLPLGGCLTSIFAGWVLNKQILRDEISDHGRLKGRLFGLLVVLLRYVCPTLLLSIFLYNLGLFTL